jgi:hypothetical protein
MEVMPSEGTTPLNAEEAVKYALGIVERETYKGVGRVTS